MNDELGFDKGRQLVVDQRKKMTIAYCNHFIVADSKDYNEVHGKYSCIQIKAEDFSCGKGESALWTYHNVQPNEIRCIYQLAKSIFPLNVMMPYKKEFYHPFKGKYTALCIEHAPKLNNPFVCTMTQGTCDKNLKRIGEPTIKITVMYSDELFFSVWDTLYSRLRDWERYHYSLLLKDGEPKTAAAIAYYRENSSNKKETPQYASSNGCKQPQKKPDKQQTYNSMPAALPVPPIEDNIPFNEMPAYGSRYMR